MFLALAEFAWLVVFGSVFLFLQTSNTLRTVRADLQTNKTNLTNQTARAEKYAKENEDLRKVITNVDDSLLALNTLRTNYAELLARSKTQERDQAEKERLLVEARSLQTQLQRDLNRLQIANTELGQSNRSLVELNRELRQTNLELGKRNHYLEDEYAAKSNLVGQLEATNAQLQIAISTDVAIRRNLVGLPPGELTNVVFVFDTSLSMKNSRAWEESVKLVRMWLEHLPVTECALVMFDDKVRPFPNAGGYQTIRDSETKRILAEQQKRLLNWFDRCPSGNTSDLLSALSHVYSSLPTAKQIIVFSDGKPQAVGDGISAHRRKVENLVRQHRDIPITCIAVNNYFTDPSATSFLKTLSAETKGAFIGR